MANPSNKQMLRDANGDLIPQYWDVVAGDFKPLTGQGGAQDTRLTGSNVEDGMPVKQVGNNGERVTIVNGESLTDTSSKYVAISEHIKNAQDITFGIRNTLRANGQPVRVSLSLRFTVYNNLIKDTEGNPLFHFTEIKGDTYDLTILTDRTVGWELLNKINYPTLYLYYRAESVPDEGSLTVYLNKKTGGLIDA